MIQKCNELQSEAMSDWMPYHKTKNKKKSVKNPKIGPFYSLNFLIC